MSYLEEQQKFNEGWESYKKHVLPSEKSTSFIKGLIVGFCSALILENIIEIILK